MRPPLSKLDIPVSQHGFYAGFSKDVVAGAKLLIMALMVWAVAFPENAASALGCLNTLILGVFNYWYIYAVAFFLLLCLVLALLPASGRLRLGHDDERPEFSNFSWLDSPYLAAHDMEHALVSELFAAPYLQDGRLVRSSHLEKHTDQAIYVTRPVETVS